MAFVIAEKRFLENILYTEEQYRESHQALHGSSKFNYVTTSTSVTVSDISIIINGFFYKLTGSDIFSISDGAFKFINISIPTDYVVATIEDNPVFSSDIKATLCRVYRIGTVVYVDRTLNKEYQELKTVSTNFTNHQTSLNPHSAVLKAERTMFGLGASATGNPSTAIGYYATASGVESVAIGHAATCTHGSSVVIGTGNSTANNQIVLGGINYAVRVNGSFSVGGAKQFMIDHPNPKKTDTHYLVHSAVETNTAGDNLYRYTIEAKKDDDVVVINLPDYFSYLNTNVQIFTTAETSYGGCFGIYSETNNNVAVHCQLAGEYSVMVIGTRKDDHPSVRNFEVERLKEQLEEVK